MNETTTILNASEHAVLEQPAAAPLGASTLGASTLGAPMLDAPQHPERTPEEIARIDALNELAWSTRNESPAEAFERAEEAHQRSQEIGYAKGVIYSAISLGMRANFYSDVQAGLRYAHEALHLLERTPDKRAEGRVYFLLGFLQWNTGNYEEGLSYALKALDVTRSLGELEGEAWALYALGTFYNDLHDYTQALEHYEQALSISREHHFPFNEARTLNGIGAVCLSLGEYQRALEYLLQSLTMNKSLNNPASTARSLADIGKAYQHLEDFARAEEYFNAALAIRERVQQKQGVVTSLLDLGMLFTKQRRTNEALFYLNRALALSEEISSRPKTYQIHLAMAELYEQMGAVAKALWHFKAYHRIKEQVTGDEQNVKFRNLRAVMQSEKSAREVERAEREAEIFRLKNVEMARANVKLAEAYQRVVETERRSEELLLNVLPPTIAERLKKGAEVIAEHFSSVTVIFADIVGFTQFSAQNSAEEIVQMLNWVFSIFDELTERFGLEKIKTIGDAYMIASGIPTLRADHAEAAAVMALAMLEEIRTFSAQSGLTLNVRIGMHSGSVVAGVIGKKKFIYDLWGDTVNLASRMESHGEPGRVHCSEALYECLKDQFTFEPRGMIDVKGKGVMPTYFLLGAKT